jgi:hypothetical protein
MEPEVNGHAGANGKLKGEAGARLERYLSGSEAVVLHRLGLPGNGRKIDHLIVGPAGVTVVDSRHYLGGKAKFEGGRLRIGRRNRTELIGQVLDQADTVRELLSGTRYADIRVDAAIAVGQVGGVPSVSFGNGREVIVWGTGLIAREASRPGPLSPENVDTLATFLTESR